MTAESHPLFVAYPLKGEREISVGRVPTPYHIYDGHGLFIGGTANLTSITALLCNEAVHPIRTTDEQAVMGIWVIDFTKASLGAHNEIQVSILVSHEPVPPIEPHPLILLKALFTDPAARMFCYLLWNNTDTVVAYNRELLGLNAALNQGQINYADGHKSFRFADVAGNMIFEGQITVAKRTSLRVSWQMFRLLGLRQTMKALVQPYLSAKVVNPISDEFPCNADAQSLVASDTPIIQLFDPTQDSLRFGQTEMAQTGFQPQFIEHFEPFRFVYLLPEC